MTSLILPTPWACQIDLVTNARHQLTLNITFGRTSDVQPQRPPAPEKHTAQLFSWLQEYFTCGQTKPLQEETIRTLLNTGTEFQQRVWLALTRIPAGDSISYQTLAERCQSGARAVANACRDNPLPLIIPCHRVTSKNGIGGYMGQSAGPAIKFKSLLLQHESRS